MLVFLCAFHIFFTVLLLVTYFVYSSDSDWRRIKMCETPNSKAARVTIRTSTTSG